MLTTLGERAYLIREACGTGVGKPERGEDFAARLTVAAGGRRTFDKSWVSRVEANVLTPKLEDIALLAAVDPLRRGKHWLAWGSFVDETAAPQNPGAAEKYTRPVAPTAQGKVIPREMYVRATHTEESLAAERAARETPPRGARRKKGGA